MIEEVVNQRGTTLVRRLRLEPGEATRWHIDLCHRVSVVLQGSSLDIEYRDGSVTHRVEVTPGQAGWDEPFARPHRAVNSGAAAYEEVSVFFLDRADLEPQPTVEEG